MSTPNFDSLAPILQPALDALEAERLRVRRSTANAAMWAAVGFAVVAFAGTILAGGFNPFVLLLPLIIAGGIVGWTYSSGAKEYRTGFKMLVMPYLVSSFGDLQYQHQLGISENEFRASGMFRSPDRYRCEDLVEGRIGETALRFSEVHAEYRSQTTDSKGHTRTEYHDIFRGLFVIAEFNKNFTGVTHVLPDTAQKMFGSFGQSLQGLGAKMSGRELVKLEDPEFEKQFVVYSRDQVEARYLLSPSLMRRLLDFRAKCNSSFHLAFMANQIYLAIPTATDWFEPSIGKELSMEALAPYAQQMQFATGIVEDLDLNTRIWSKQSSLPDVAAPAFDPRASTAPNAPMQARWEN
ncbi:MAG TPA: DUF3137 domain-containing protein [Abditibacteriaceae bacterium]|jgi:hypothetical protein